MDAKNMVSWKVISTVLTGNGNTVRVDRPNKKYQKEIESLLDYVQDWMDRKGVVGEVKVTAVVSKKQKKPLLESQEEKVVKLNNQKIENAVFSGNNSNNLYVLVDSLPKDRKSMTEEGYRGLYTSEGKFYTNKVIDNKLEIREWKDLNKAKIYLNSLKNK